MNRVSHLNSLDVDYEAGHTETATDYQYTEDKLEQAREVLRTALSEYDQPAVLWMGDKDSTLVLYLVRTLLDETDGELAEPTVLFIDHGQHFSDVMDFVVRWGYNWDFDVEVAWNRDDVLYGLPGEDVTVADLTERNTREVRDRLDFDEAEFPLRLDHPVGVHLLKTVALSDALEAHDIDGLVTGTRWDEAECADETFFSPRRDVGDVPPHDRVQPLLPFTEWDVWDATWTEVVPETVDGFPMNTLFPKSADRTDLYGYDYREIPVCPRYYQGYQSFDGVTNAESPRDVPPWTQEMSVDAE